MIFVRLLHPEARHQLRAPWSPPRPTPEGDRMPHVDVNRLPLEGAGGLVEALATVPDPRQRRGIRHPVRGILAVSAAATLAGARSFQAIAEFAAELAPDLLRRLGIPRGAPPSVKCFRLTLQKLDSHHFDRVLSAWLVQHQILAGHPIALDGKTRRGSASATTPARLLLSAILPDLGVVIAQQAGQGATLLFVPSNNALRPAKADVVATPGRSADRRRLLTPPSRYDYCTHADHPATRNDKDTHGLHQALRRREPRSGDGRPEGRSRQGVTCDSMAHT